MTKTSSYAAPPVITDWATSALGVAARYQAAALDMTQKSAELAFDFFRTRAVSANDKAQAQLKCFEQDPFGAPASSLGALVEYAQETATASATTLQNLADHSQKAARTLQVAA